MISRVRAEGGDVVAFAGLSEAAGEVRHGKLRGRDVDRHADGFCEGVLGPPRGQCAAGLVYDAVSEFDDKPGFFGHGDEL